MVNALGAVIPELRSATGLPATTTGVLLSLPTLSFAVMGLAPRCWPLALITGQLIRSLVPGTTALLAGSLIALAGIAVGNVGHRWPPRRGRRSPSASAT